MAATTSQPWLDSLSEDWRSEVPSSPSNSSRPGSAATNGSPRTSTNQSRIPHLAHNIRSASNNSSFLKPRSSKGIARRQENGALAEKTASNLNAMPISPNNGSKRRSVSGIPRRASSVLSESQGSVQHHSIDRDAQPQDTPEWKKRIKSGGLDSDQLDLFSPSKLEGMFKQSSCPAEPENNENEDSVLASDSKPWTSLNSSGFPLPADRKASRRASRFQVANMDTVEEADEDQPTRALSAISSDVARDADIHGIVRRRVSDLESVEPAIIETFQPRLSNDPRMRTISGRKEISDEIFSDLEDSEKSGLRKQALLDSIERKSRSRAESNHSFARSYSPSSDHDVSYQAENNEESSLVPDAPIEMTSHSLPEDLSMGTQNYAGDSVLLGTKRKPSNRAASYAQLKRKEMPNSSSIEEDERFPSSPPPYLNDGNEKSNLSFGEPASMLEESVVHHAPTSAPQSNIASPLKLFGTRDTYTNNKLMRVLSQYENDQSDLELPKENASQTPFSMSNFGRGELDGFGFDKQVDRPVPEIRVVDPTSSKLFTDLGNLSKSHQASPDQRQPSPVKQRSPKRRRTLVQDSIDVDGAEIEVKVSHLAGTKRRDALPGTDSEQASPNTMAARAVIRPSGSRRSSREGHKRAISASESLRDATDASECSSQPQLAEKLAAELENFTQQVTEKQTNSRKPSYATKDYMAEANKVMELIRARGKPEYPMPKIVEPDDSELGADSILDLEVDDSTKDSFSRPPSREGQVLPRLSERVSQHDTVTADHLKRFHEPDDLDILTSTSVIGTWPAADNKAVEVAAMVPVPEDDQADFDSMHSEPPGMRILNANDKKRKHSGTETDRPGSQGSQSTESERSRPGTTSSTASGQRGIINQGTIEIPEKVGTMSWDRETQRWIKQKLQAAKAPAANTSPGVRSNRPEQSEADPFDGIPDLSIDEIKEASWKKSPLYKQRGNISTDEDARPSSRKSEAIPFRFSTETTPAHRAVNRPLTEAAQHEQRLHNGEPSQELPIRGKHQPRVVTIAFSSPIASEIPYSQPPALSDDLDEDDPSLLPIDDDDSVLESSPPKFQNAAQHAIEQPASRNRTIMGSLERHEQYRAMTLTRRPISRIDENDEEAEEQPELSLIHVRSTELTPLPDRQVAVATGTGKKDSSILCLTPLSEFTLHQADKLNHPEESYIAERANPKALRQAHGSAALVQDALVKAITDAEPTELFWEELRGLTLTKSSLAALHGLDEYCQVLEVLDVSENQIAQLTGLPSSIRSLNIASNMVNDLTSWTHLHNLQSIDVSGNKLESLDCFGNLFHLRHLNAANNRVRNIEGIIDLNALATLDLSGNNIAKIDFHSNDLASLEKLDLSGNGMTEIRSIDCLPQLKYLDLGENRLQELVVEGDKMALSLETLSLPNNDMTTLDLTAFPALQRLNADGNQLTNLTGLSEAEQLTVLSVREQRVISNLANKILTTEHECIELYLSSNVFPDTGLALPQVPNYTLRVLELTSCGLNSLPDTFGHSFPNLRMLNANFNALSDLSQLQGAIKLCHLYLAKNRIKRMRRTCLTLSRLPKLRRVDLRDNPLTIGFYPPTSAEDAHRLMKGNIESDEKWVGLMDEMTWLRRRAMELLLAECCAGLQDVDGLVFDRTKLMKEKATWDRLMGKGVLRQPEDATND